MSAHLVIRLSAQGESDRCSALLEDTEGLSQSRIVHFLRALLATNVNFIETLPSGDTASIDEYLTSNAVLDKPIGEQLQDARLIAVDLVKRMGSGKIDQTREYIEYARMIQFRPTAPSRGARAKRIIEHILETSDINDYKEVRIRVDEGDGHQRSVRVDRSKSDAFAGAFQLRTLISDLRPPLEEASKTLVVHLVSAMAKLLR